MMPKDNNVLTFYARVSWVGHATKGNPEKFADGWFKIFYIFTTQKNKNKILRHELSLSKWHMNDPKLTGNE